MTLFNCYYLVGRGYFPTHTCARSLKQNNEISVSSRSDDTIEIKDNKDSTKASVSISYLKESIKSASDLITTRYFYKDANTYKNTKTFFDHEVPFTTDETVYTYEGTVSLGIDISQISFSVDNTKLKL